MADESNFSDATVQMSPEDVARMHQQFADQNPGGRSPRPGATAGSQTASIIGGIGAIILLAAMVFGFLPKLQGFGDDFVMPLFIAATAGYIALAVGLFGTASRTSNIGVLAGVFALLLGLVYSTVLLAEAHVLSFGDVDVIVMYGTFFGPALAWTFIAVWAFAGVRPLSPGLGTTAGICAMIGGLAHGAAYGLLMTGTFDRGDQEDTFMMLDMAALGGMAIAAILLAVAFFGPIARASRR